ncbi:hypothetical protein [Streptomyces sp. 8N706]|uniref:hypothetical protein n=1 Tax=Streptomyces sp. 8N706 TaxID=3457416 RepID=UPI003FD1326F
MLEYELHRARHAQLVREAAEYRLARQAVRARRRAGRASAQPAAAGRVTQSAAGDGGGSVRAARA